MADDQGNSSSQQIGESSDSTIEINVKTLDSRIYTFRVNQDTSIPSLKEKVASETGVPMEQQRLIFRGKVLKDEHLLSDYHLEDGHTLHLVARQPVQAQTQPGTGSGDPFRVNDTQGGDTGSNAPRNRIGQISHSVVLGTVNIADQGEGMIADIGRVVGAVMQSFGAGILTPASEANNTASASNQAFPSGETEGSYNVGGRTHPGNQAQPAVTVGNQPFQVQLPSPGVVSRNMVVPDSLTTLSEFISRMELILQSSGSQSSAPSIMRDPPRSDNASLNLNRLPTPDVLGSVIERAGLLLSGNVAAALSRMAERLRGEVTSSDPMVQSQIQSNAVHLGLVMQHLGAMLLELGRTTMMLRMGPSPDNTFVNSGPAIYISSSGPNPIMVQPFSPQTSSLLNASSPLLSGPSNPLVGGDLSRNINIHILSGTSLAPGISSSGGRTNSGDGNRSEHQNMEQARQNSTGSGDLGPMGGIPARTAGSSIPARSFGETASHVLSVAYPVHVRSQLPTNSALSQGSHPPTGSGTQPNTSVIVPHSSSESGSIPAIVAQVNAHMDGGSARSQSSSPPSLQSTGAQGSHLAMNNESHSNMNVQLPQTSSGMNNISARQINELIANIISGNAPRQSSSGAAGQQLLAMNNESHSNMNVQLPQTSSGMNNISARQINELIANIISGNAPRQSSSGAAGQQLLAMNNESHSNMNVQLPQTSSGMNNISARQINELIANIISGNAPRQSSSGAAGQQLLAMNNESHSNMNVQLPQTSSGMNNISARQINELIANIISGNAPRQSSSGAAGQQLNAEGSSSTNTGENAVNSQTDSVADAASNFLESHVPNIATQGDGKQLERHDFSTTADHLRRLNLEESSTTGLMGGDACCQPSDTHSTVPEEFSEKNLKSTVASHDSLSSQGSGSDRPTPLGLGLGGLQPKSQRKSTKPVGKDGGTSRDVPSVNQNQESIAKGQQALRSFVSRGSDVNRENINGSSTRLHSILSQLVDGMSLGGQGSREQVDAGEVMSHVLQSPAFNNLLMNVAEQTGIGSPADLRSMMEQCIQSPAMTSTLNNIVQQVEGRGQDLGSMLLGSGSGEGGIDFSRMIQQMMPIVSQAIGRMSSLPVSDMGSDHQPQSNNMINQDGKMQDGNCQIDLHEARERIEQRDSPGSIFGAMLEGAGNLHGEEDSYEDLVQELGDNVELSDEYMEILQRHIRQRVYEQSKSEENS